MPDIYNALEKRIRASGGTPKDILELDARVLKYEGAEQEMERALTPDQRASIKSFVERVTR